MIRHDRSILVYEDNILVGRIASFGKRTDDACLSKHYARAKSSGKLESTHCEIGKEILKREIALPFSKKGGKKAAKGAHSSICYSSKQLRPQLQDSYVTQRDTKAIGNGLNRMRGSLLLQ